MPLRGRGALPGGGEGDICQEGTAFPGLSAAQGFDFRGQGVVPSSEESLNGGSHRDLPAWPSPAQPFSGSLRWSMTATYWASAHPAAGRPVE